MPPEMENPASGGAPEIVEVGASNASDNTIVRFRGQGLRTADAVIGQLGALGVAEAAGADLDTIAAMQGVDLDPAVSPSEPAPADWTPAPGSGLLGMLGLLAKEGGAG